MARDADDNYYYDEGTIAEQFENWDVYEDEDGNVGFYYEDDDSSAELRLHEAGHVFGSTRGDPTTEELADGESMLFVSDGTGTGADGDLVFASSDGTTITTTIAADLVA